MDYLEGDIICRKGEFGSDFYIVLDGVVNCSTSDNPIIPSESEPSKLISNDIICRLKAGDWFGEESLSSSPYLSNVTADSSIRLLAFNRDMFENVVGSLKDIVDRKQNEEMLMSLPLLERAPVDKVGILFISLVLSLVSTPLSLFLSDLFLSKHSCITERSIDRDV